MNVIHIRPKRDAVQIRDLGCQNPTLQSRMNGLHSGLLPVHVLIQGNHFIPQGRIHPVGPARIVPCDFAAPAGQGCQRPHLIKQRLLAALHTTAHGELRRHSAAVHFQDSQIQGSLHQSLHIGAHGLDAAGQTVEIIHRPL